MYIIRARHFRIRVANLTGFIYIRPFLLISDEGKILPTGDDHPPYLYLFIWGFSHCPLTANFLLEMAK